MAGNDKLKFEADVSGFIQAKEQVKKGLNEIGEAAEKAADKATNALGKVDGALKTTGRNASGAGAVVGGVGAYIGRDGRNTGRVGPTRANAASLAGAAAGGAAAGKVGGSLLGRLAGGLGGPIGVMIGSTLGSMLGDMFGGGPEGKSVAEQMRARGFDDKTAQAIERFSQDMGAKYETSSQQIVDAIMNAGAGNDRGLDSMLRDAGLNPDDYATANDKIAALSGASAGAAEAAKSPWQKAQDKFATTVPGMMLEGIKNVPTETGRNITDWAARRLNDLSDWLGTTDQGQAQSSGFTIDAPEKPGRRRNAGGGDMRIVVSAAKNVPTMTRNMAGR